MILPTAWGGLPQEVVLNDSFLVLKHGRHVPVDDGRTIDLDDERLTGNLKICSFEPLLEWAMDEKTEFWNYDLNEMSKVQLNLSTGT